MPPGLVASLVALALLPLPVLAGAPEDPRRPEVPTAVEYEGDERDVLRDDAPRPRSKRSVPPPKDPRRGPRRPKITVAVGLSPEAPGSKAERRMLDRLERSATQSTDPKAHVRRLRPGVGDARLVCRERRDDLIIMIGYLPGRADPVLLPHDCRLDRPMGVRAGHAADEQGLVGVLWSEHEELVRQGAKERWRSTRLGPKARAGIIAGVALVVVGVAVGLLVANALRKEAVVLTVSP